MVKGNFQINIKSTGLKHEKLAHRLTDILTRLNSGESLNPLDLASEYHTSLRTIQRDFGERLVYLPLQKVDGCFKLDISYLGCLNFNDIKQFATLSGVLGMYPSLDKNFIRELLDHRASLTYTSKGQFHEDPAQYAKLLTLFKTAIQEQRQVSFLYKDTPRVVQPYRLIHHHGCWYLAAVRKNVLRAYRLSRIELPVDQHEMDKFVPDRVILKQLENEESIWFGLEKQEIILTINQIVASHFQQRQLLPEQSTVKELANGDLIVSSKITHATQLLPLVRYWMPHVKIVNPIELQQQLESEIREYLS